MGSGHMGIPYGQTDATENITFSQTMYMGGNKVERPQERLYHKQIVRPFAQLLMTCSATLHDIFDMIYLSISCETWSLVKGKALSKYIQYLEKSKVARSLKMYN